MLAPDPATAQSALSVIVPSRDEEASLGACLESLVAQTGVTFEIIVVDDASTDRTREIAQSFSGVQVIDAGPLPEGWTGKNNAMSAGAKQARGEWLLFTDADTVHSLTSLARGLTEAELRQVQLLSYSPEQEVHGFWQEAVMPVIFAELATTYRPSEVSDPNSPAAAANGQYLLISREAYDSVGGHAAMAGSLLEDVALARAVKSSGRKIFFRYGGDVLRTRMYRNFAQLCEGWTKNLALLFPSTRRLALLRLLEFILILATAGLAFIEGIRGRANAALVMAAATTIVLYVLFLLRIRKAHFPWRANAVAMLGLPLFAYLLHHSELSYKQGAVSWKGRAYDTQLAEPEPEQHPERNKENAAAIVAGRAAQSLVDERSKATSGNSTNAQAASAAKVAALTPAARHSKHSGA